MARWPSLTPTSTLPAGHPRAESKATTRRGDESGVPGPGLVTWDYGVSFGDGEEVKPASSSQGEVEKAVQSRFVETPSPTDRHSCFASPRGHVGGLQEWAEGLPCALRRQHLDPSVAKARGLRTWPFAGDPDRETTAWRWQELPRWRGGLPWRPVWILPAGHPRAESKATTRRGDESGVPGPGLVTWDYGVSFGDGEVQAVAPLAPCRKSLTSVHSAEMCRTEQPRGVSCHLSVVPSVSFVPLVLYMPCLISSGGLPETLASLIASLGSSARRHRSFASGALRGLGIASVLKSIRWDVF
ncbi:uncharacterized protein LOC111943425 [Cyanistes caeruleus]|uniref:uncharacterized protein LOC111943425 n=1 Tax=Cyanistes caeruleus TaxID=156563 RepID=UPI000CDAF5F5|nr:uncharacterized protein LOC111943425 [Cyanistes caeruleus]